MSRIPKSQLEAYDDTREQRMTDEDRLLIVIKEAGHAETLAELTVRFNRKWGTNKPESTISGRLNGLEAKGKVTTYLTRQCKVSGRNKQTWYLAPASDGVQLTLGWTVNTRILPLALILLFVSCASPEPEAAEPTTETVVTATADTDPPPSDRLTLVEEAQLGAGFHWAHVWLVRDAETGAEFLVTIGREGVHTLQIRTEARQ